MTVREHMLLTIAAATYARSGQREADMLHHCGYTPARGWQVLNGLLQRPDVEAEAPAVVRRLRRLRDARARARVAG